MFDTDATFHLLMSAFDSGGLSTRELLGFMQTLDRNTCIITVVADCGVCTVA